MTALSAKAEQVIECALDWQEAVDRVVTLAPLPMKDLVAQVAVEHATAAHMALLHAVRALRTESKLG